MITSLDLVAWQLLVASGHPLPLTQSQIPLLGHAFEARIYAESPAHSFSPAAGPILSLSTPSPSSTIRVELGVEEGESVGVYYDPMIAKLVVWGNDRREALRRMDRALSEWRVVGVQTNVEFLRRVVRSEAFGEGDVETGFIQVNLDHYLARFHAESVSMAETLR